MMRSGDRVIGGSGDLGITAVFDRLKHIGRIARAALREIFDENAYDRFLRRTNATRSVASYRDFARERDSALSRKPRCC